ncbi:MAG: hypothetical protein R6W97_12795, partial [Thiobacillus sp.]
NPGAGKLFPGRLTVPFFVFQNAQGEKRDETQAVCDIVCIVCPQPGAERLRPAASLRRESARGNRSLVPAL